MKKRPDPPGHYLFTYHLCAQMHPTTVINKFVPTGIEHLVNQPLKKADPSTLARSSCIPYNGNFPLMKENHMKNTINLLSMVRHGLGRPTSNRGGLVEMLPRVKINCHLLSSSHHFIYVDNDLG